MILKFRTTTFSDLQVIEAYQNGDKRVQQFWYDKCRSQFNKGTSNYGGLTDDDRNDLFHESFAILWEKMETRQIDGDGDSIYVMTKNGIRPVPDMLGYFMRIVKNKYLEWLRERKPIVSMEDVMAESGDIDDSEAFNVLYWNEDPEVEKDNIVSKCLMSLPKSCIEILTMFFYQKKTLEQILEERPENSSYDGLKTRKSKCMGNLKKKISVEFAKAGLS